MCTPARNHANKNFESENRTFDNVPPENINDEAHEITKLIRKYDKQNATSCFGSELIQEARPFLISIKEKLGKQHPYYLDISTQLGNLLLDNVFVMVNTVLRITRSGQRLSKNVLSDKSKKSYEHWNYQQSWEECKEYVSRGIEFSRIFTFDDTDVLHLFFRDAWYAISCAKLLDTDQSFQNRLLEYESTFNGIVSDFHFEFNSSSITIYDMSGVTVETKKIPSRLLFTDDEMFESCSSRYDFEEYLHFYPNGKHLKACQDKIVFFKEKEKEVFKSSKTKRDFENYLSTYPVGDYFEEAHDAIKRINSRNRYILLFSLIILLLLIIIFYFFL